VVVAVLYEENEPGRISFPPPYQLVAVGRDLETFIELPDDHESPYSIRGRK